MYDKLAQGAGWFVVYLLITTTLDIAYKFKLMALFGAIYKKGSPFQYSVMPIGKALMLILTSALGAASMMADRQFFFAGYVVSLTAFGIYAAVIYRAEARSS